MPEQYLMVIVQNIINDKELEHLSIKDLKNVLLNIQPIMENIAEAPEREGGKEESVDVKRYVL